ncbi:MAG: hypothetical protein Q8P92_04470 [Candidatus Daviesbacteria bacterium]|nr:hypothetical protein [Candidatus Daviesbacteria bacterium]
MTRNSKAVTHTISIIRSRGQLTIPDSIRAIREWSSPNSVVTITSDRPDEIVIRPHKKEYDWDKMWKLINKSRSFKGKEGNLSQFIAEDRNSH